MKTSSTSRFACGEVRELSDACIDNELLVETHLGVLLHMGRCEDCRTLILGEIRVKQLIRGAVRSVESPPHLGRRLRWLPTQEPRCQNSKERTF